MRSIKARKGNELGTQEIPGSACASRAPFGTSPNSPPGITHPGSKKRRAQRNHEHPAQFVTDHLPLPSQTVRLIANYKNISAIYTFFIDPRSGFCSHPRVLCNASMNPEIRPSANRPGLAAHSFLLLA